MNKLDFFNLLDEQKSAREWINEWLAIKNGYRVETPLRIVYVRNGKIEVLDYLDLSRKSDVWGIEANGYCWKKDYYAQTTYDTAKNIAERVGNRVAEIPTTEYMEFMASIIPSYNATVNILCEHGIDACGWNVCDIPYATADAQNRENVFVFCARLGGIDIVGRNEKLQIKIGFKAN